MRSLVPLTLVLAVLLLSSCRLLQQTPQTGGVPVGQAAPEIVGEDVDGVRFKLSDYRGKVVVVVFWATWCPPCRAMLPHERALVARLEGQPFALLGVNADDERGELKQFLAAKHVTWRHWCDGGTGPIAKQFGVKSWPTVYVLDAQGVVRYRDIRGPELDQAVETLLREVQPKRR